MNFNLIQMQKRCWIAHPTPNYKFELEFEAKFELEFKFESAHEFKNACFQRSRAQSEPRRQCFVKIAPGLANMTIINAGFKEL